MGPFHPVELTHMSVDPLVSSVVQLKAAQTASSVQYAVAAKLLQTERQGGAAVLKLIDAADQEMNQAAESVADSAVGGLDVMA